MELIIKNFEKLSVESQQDIQDSIAGHTPDFVLLDLLDLIEEIKHKQTQAIANWRKKFEEKQGFDPSHIDLDKVLELIQTGEINDQDLVFDPKQKTLEAFS